mmetsp:Transcript_13234/g.20966  ORF Transcript_13234/g.20966 Transcript_13234/m.20966 type:complete len:308 (-) Transcript_13234:2918-3841(-)
MRLQGINAFPGDVGIQLIGVIEVATVRDVGLRCVLVDLDAHRITATSFRDGLVILLDANDSTDIQIVLFWDANWSSDPQLAADDLTANDNGVSLAEHVILINLQHNREDRNFPGFDLLGLMELLHIGLELVLQVINDIGGENGNVVRYCLLGRFCIHLHVESKNHCILLLLLLHDGSLLHILLVDLSNAHIEDRNLHIGQEAKQRLQGSQGAGLDVHADRLLLEAVEDALEGVVHLLLELLDVVIRAHHQHLGAGYRVVQAGSADLHAHRRADLRMVDVLTLDPHLLHGLRSEQCSDGRDDWSIHAG